MTNLSPCFSALADPTRRQIFEKIARRPSAVGDLARSLPISRPAVSQHLKALSLAELVCSEAQGTRRIYRLDFRGVRAMRLYFDQFWTHALTEFKNAVESDESAKINNPK